MILSDVMDEVARRLRGLEGVRAYEWPTNSVQSPAAVVLYPQRYDYDETYGRGTDRMTLPVAVLVGRTTERSTRDILSALISGEGPKSLKAVLDGGGYDSCDTVRVMNVEIDVMTMSGVDYWGAVCNLDVLGPGSN